LYEKYINSKRKGIDIFKNKIPIILLLLFLSVFLLSSCNGGEYGDTHMIETSDITIETNNSNNKDIPFVLIEISDDNQIIRKKTGESGFVSFQNLDLSENKKYVAKAVDYETPETQFIVKDDYAEIIFENADLISSDDFSNKESGWPVKTNEDLTRLEYVNGKYEIEINSLNHLENLQWPSFSNGINDFVISSDMKFINGFGVYGYLINWKDNNIVIEINHNNNTNTLRVRENKNNILERDLSKQIKIGEYNNLMLVKKNDTMDIYLDRELIDTIKISESIPKNAYIKVRIGSSSTKGIELLIDDFRLIELY
jgi:hypothetical protein